MIDTVTDFGAALTDFGVSATLSVGGSASVLFDAPYADALQIYGNAQRSATGKTTDLSAVTVGSTLTINAVAYTVAAIEPDGTGMTRLALK